MINRILACCFTLSLLISSGSLAAPLKIVCHEFAPFSFINAEGKTTGVLVEMIRTACKEWPEGCEIDLLPNRRAKQLFHSGKANGHFLGWNPQRAQEMWFSVPLIDTEYGFYTLPEFKLSQVEQAAGKTIAVFMPSNTYYALKALEQKLINQGLSPLKIRPFTAGNSQPLKMLIRERFDAYYVNKAVGAYYAQQLGYKDLAYLPASETIRYFLAFKKESNDKSQIKQFNQLLFKLKREGKFDRLYQKWNVSPSQVSPSEFEQLSIPF